MPEGEPSPAFRCIAVYNTGVDTYARRHSIVFACVCLHVAVCVCLRRPSSLRRFYLDASVIAFPEGINTPFPGRCLADGDTLTRYDKEAA